MSDTVGKVYLVGAGPGDPGLITVRGREVLAMADVVLHDELANPHFQGWARQAEWIYVGKNTANHSLQQEEINRLLIECAQRYGVVVRLKGGDPFVFGRGGEEALALRAAGIPFEVVPGITSGIAAPAYAGIPVTHRGLSSSVTFMTAHAADAARQSGLDRIALEGTLCFYMGVARLHEVVQSLFDLGRAPETPAAIIEWGTYGRQRVVESSLSGLVEASKDAGIGAPAMVVVGEVAALRTDLNWFEERPLFGLRIVLTHGPNRAGALEERLRSWGASVFNMPTLEVRPAPLSETPPTVTGYDWVLLTSPNAAEAFFRLLDEQDLDARALAGTRFCAVGHATAAALERRFLRVDARPASYEPRDVLAAMGDLDQTRVLMPRAELARRAAAEALQTAGAEVTEVAAYATTAPAIDPALLQAVLDFDAHLVVFTNSAAVRHFSKLFEGEALATLSHRAQFASIGPLTSRSLLEHGLPVALEAARHDVLHLAEAIALWWEQHESS